MVVVVVEGRGRRGGEGRGQNRTTPLIIANLVQSQASSPSPLYDRISESRTETLNIQTSKRIYKQGIDEKAQRVAENPCTQDPDQKNVCIDPYSSNDSI